MTVLALIRLRLRDDAQFDPLGILALLKRVGGHIDKACGGTGGDSSTRSFQSQPLQPGIIDDKALDTSRDFFLLSRWTDPGSAIAYFSGVESQWAQLHPFMEEHFQVYSGRYPTTAADNTKTDTFGTVLVLTDMQEGGVDVGALLTPTALSLELGDSGSLRGEGLISGEGELIVPCSAQASGGEGDHGRTTYAAVLRTWTQTSAARKAHTAFHPDLLFSEGDRSMMLLLERNRFH
ncbi:hypothetical protein PYCC9005_000080 [Savitreella phatthalungensis]